MLFVAVEAFAESMALVRKARVDEHAFVDLIANMMFAAPVYKGHAPLITRLQHQPLAFAAR